MPIINREKTTVPDGTKNIEWVREIAVGSSGTFSIKLPPHIGKALDRTDVYGQTKSEALKKWEEAIKDAQKSKAVVTRVIIYSANISANLPSLGEGKTRRSAVRKTQLGYNIGIGLAIHADVRDEVKTANGKGGFSFRYDRVDSTLPAYAGLAETPNNGDREYPDRMEWTLQRETFFAGILAGMERLVRDVDGIFNGYSGDFMSIVDGKKNNPLLLKG